MRVVGLWWPSDLCNQHRSGHLRFASPRSRIEGPYEPGLAIPPRDPRAAQGACALGWRGVLAPVAYFRDVALMSVFTTIYRHQDDSGIDCVPLAYRTPACDKLRAEAGRRLA